jgi:hypothetical protein
MFPADTKCDEGCALASSDVFADFNQSPCIATIARDQVIAGVKRNVGQRHQSLETRNSSLKERAQGDRLHITIDQEIARDCVSLERFLEKTLPLQSMEEAAMRTILIYHFPVRRVRIIQFDYSVRHG